MSCNKPLYLVFGFIGSLEVLEHNDKFIILFIMNVRVHLWVIATELSIFVLCYQSFRLIKRCRYGQISSTYRLSDSM